MRCAIYTRKSSDEGLEQSFNSLDAQREACEAYVTSQLGEGWTALPTLYDDGGFSGGSMERPALRRLLDDVAHRKIDVIVVYKVDRLTRSLADFARIVDILDANGASFVSVTQAFNTTSSMGRLTLNVLLSFAQFEREVTGERIRDKIAASKKKGMWMGGTPPLGYLPHERTLVIDEDEDAKVRHIFDRYLELGSVHELKRELDLNNVRGRAAKESGERQAFSRGALYHLLSNRTYVGEIVHKDECYPGQHAPLIERALFEQVQQLLAANRSDRKQRVVSSGRAPLAGIIFDAEGRTLTPVSSRNARGQIYRYYVSAHLQQGGHQTAAAGQRVPAPAIEEIVMDRLRRLGCADSWAAARSHLTRIEVHPGGVVMQLHGFPRSALKGLKAPDVSTELPGRGWQVNIECVFRQWRGQSRVTQQRHSYQESRSRIDRTLVRALTRAHALQRRLAANPEQTIESLAGCEGLTPAYVQRLVRLAFLAPDVQEAICEGRQPVGISLEQLMRTPVALSWSDQRERFRNASRSVTLREARKQSNANHYSSA